MWFTLLFGVLSLAAGAVWAVGRDPRRLRATAGFAGATLFATLCGIAADLAAVGHAMNEKWDEFSQIGVARVLCQGFAESMSPAILGFTLLALTAFVVAVGYTRRPAVDTAIGHP